MNSNINDVKIRCNHNYRGEVPESEWEEESFLQFIKSDPILSSCINLGCVIPPKSVFNEFFGYGETNAGMSGGSSWKPFHLTDEQYETIVKWAESEIFIPFKICRSEEIISSVHSWRQTSLQNMMDYRLDPEYSLRVINSSPSDFAFDFHISNLSSSLNTFKHTSRRDGRFSNLTEENVSKIEAGFIEYLRMHETDKRWLSVILNLASISALENSRFLQNQIKTLMRLEKWYESCWILKSMRRHYASDNELDAIVFGDEMTDSDRTHILWGRYMKSPLYSNEES